jgi:hypothetical protein
MMLDRTRGISKVNAIRTEWMIRNMTGRRSRILMKVMLFMFTGGQLTPFEHAPADEIMRVSYTPNLGQHEIAQDLGWAWSSALGPYGL